MKRLERVAANRWYSVTSLADDISLVAEPFIEPFYRCNVWHVRGRTDALIDSGMGVVSLREHVPLFTERPLIAIASHTHFDHVGCHHESDERVRHREIIRAWLDAHR